MQITLSLRLAFHCFIKSMLLCESAYLIGCIWNSRFFQILRLVTAQWQADRKDDAIYIKSHRCCFNNPDHRERKELNAAVFTAASAHPINKLENHCFECIVLFDCSSRDPAPMASVYKNFSIVFVVKTQADLQTYI